MIALPPGKDRWALLLIDLEQKAMPTALVRMPPGVDRLQFNAGRDAARSAMRRWTGGCSNASRG